MRQFSPEMAQTVALVLHKRMEGMGSGGRKSYSGFKAVAELLNRLDQVETPQHHPAAVARLSGQATPAFRLSAKHYGMKAPTR